MILLRLRSLLSQDRWVYTPASSVFRDALRIACLAVCFVWCLTALSACETEGEGEIEIRIHNASTFDFTDVSVAGRDYGDIAAGVTSAYKKVKLRFRYAALELTADGNKVTGQTLNLGAERFTYEIDIIDLEAGHLAIEVIPE